MKKVTEIRLCLDQKYHNENIQRVHFLVPIVNDVFYKLSNKTIFTVLDIKEEYYQRPIDDTSADLCSSEHHLEKNVPYFVSLPFGRYQFCRLPFGICSAPEMFLKKNFEIFGDLPGVCIYFDDIIISGETEAEHDKNLRTVLERASRYNVKFNEIKCGIKSKIYGSDFLKNRKIVYRGHS